jgi:hypothetical protein
MPELHQRPSAYKAVALLSELIGLNKKPSDFSEGCVNL